MDRNDRVVMAFVMLSHAMFHTYELIFPIFVVSWLEAGDSAIGSRPESYQGGRSTGGHDSRRHPRRGRLANRQH